MDLEQTQVIDFCDDFDDETDEEIDEKNKKPVAHLKVLFQKGFPEKLFPIYEGDNVIGRQESTCSICIPLKALSREHACIEIRGESHCIFDKGSRNKTRRGKLVLRPEVRYELKDNDKLTFGDVDAVYIHGCSVTLTDGGSETGSECNFETAPAGTVAVDSPGPSPKTAAKKNNLVTNATAVVYEDEEEYDSDQSVDLLQPTQAYPAMENRKREVTLNLAGSSDDEPDIKNTRHDVTVKDTPAVRRHTGMSTLVLPESDTEDEEDRKKTAAICDMQTVPVEVVEDTQQDGHEEEDKSILYAATQAYGMDAMSDNDDDDETTDGEEDKKAMLAAATQAFTDVVDDDENEDENQTGRARTFVADSDDEDKNTSSRIAPVVAEETTDEEVDDNDIDVSAIIAAPTLACDMEEIPDDEEVKETQAFAAPECGMHDATQVFSDDDSATQVIDENVSSPQKGKRDVKHTEPTDEGDQATQIFDDDTDGETVAITDGETMAVDVTEENDVATKVMTTDDATMAVCEEATQVITDDATLAVSDVDHEISPKPAKSSKTSHHKPINPVEEATQAITDPTVDLGEAETQVFEDATMAVSETDEVLEKDKMRKKLLNENATQMMEENAGPEVATQVICEDATVAVSEIEEEQPKRGNISGGKKDKRKNDKCLGEEPTQIVTEDATVAVSELEVETPTSSRGRGRRGKSAGQEATQIITEDATVAVSELEVETRTSSRGRGKRGKSAGQEATQVITEDATVAVTELEVETPASSRGRGRRGKSAGQEATEIITEDATVAFSELEVETPTSSGGRGKRGKSAGQEATQVITEDATVAVTELEVETPASSRGRGRRGKSAGQEATQIITEDATVAVSELEVETPTSSRGRGKRGKSAGQEATQVITEDATIAVNELEVETPTSSRGRGRRGKSAGQEATQIITEDATVAVSELEVESHTSSRGRGRRGKSAGQKATVDTTVAVSELEVESPQASNARRRRGRSVEDSTGNEATQITAEDAEESHEHMPTKLIKQTKGRKTKSKMEMLSEEDNTIKKKEKTFDLSLCASDDEPTQVIEEEKDISVGIEPTVCYDMEVGEPEPEISKGSKNKKSKAKTSKEKETVEELEPTQAYGMDIVEDDTEKLLDDKSDVLVDENCLEATQVYGLDEESRSPSRRRNKNKDETVDQTHSENRRVSRRPQKDLPALPALQDQGLEATQPYAMGLDDETPPLTEEMVRDSEESISQSPVIPTHVPVIPIPATSPHKSALATPDKRKKSPSPKRVKFTKIESESMELDSVDTADNIKLDQPRATRGKVSQQEEKAVPDVGKEPSKSSRGRGRKSVPEVKTTQETNEQTQKIKTVTRGRRSLPTGVSKSTTDETVEKRSKKDGQKSKELTENEENNERVIAESVVENKQLEKKKGGRKSAKPKVLETEDATETLDKSSTTTTRRGKSKKVLEENEEDSLETSTPEIPEPAEMNVKRGSRRSKRGVDEIETEAKEKTVANKSKQSKGKVSESDIASDKATAGPSGRGRQSAGKGATDSQSEISTVESKGKPTTEPQTVCVEEPQAISKGKRTNRGKKAAVTGNTSMADDAANISTKGTDKETSIADVSGVSEPRRGRGRASKGQDLNRKDEAPAEVVNQRSKRSQKQTDNSINNTRPNFENKIKQTKDGTESDASVNKRSSKKEEIKIAVGRGRNRQSQKDSQNNDKVEENLKASDIASDSKEATQSVQEQLDTTQSNDKTGSGKRGKKVLQPTEEKSLKQESQTDIRSRGSVVNSKRGKGKEPEEMKVEATPAKRSKKSDPGTPQQSSEVTMVAISSPSLRRKSIEPNKAKVLFTGVIDQQGQKIVKDLGGELVDSVYDCTHLVTDKVRRTVKFLCCLSRGIPIVQPTWLESCKQSGMFLDWTQFLVKDSGTEKQYKFSLQRSIDKASEVTLLSGYQIHVTKSVKPEPSQMKDILQCAGAKFLVTMPKKFTEGTVVVSCEDDRKLCEAAVKADGVVVNAEFILTGILRQEVNLETFRIFNNKTSKKRPAESSEESAPKRRKR